MAVAFIGRQAKLTTDRLAGSLVGVLEGYKYLQVRVRREGLLESARKAFTARCLPPYTERKARLQQT